MKKSATTRTKKSEKHAKTKIFSHNRDLDKQKIGVEITKVDSDKNFYEVDKEELEEVLPVRSRTSSYWMPTTEASDQFLLQQLIRNINTVSRYIVGRAVKVSFSEVQSESKADFTGENITVSMGALYDHRVPFHMRLNITLGLSIHESWHCKYTTPGMERLLISNGITKNKISKFGFGKTQRVADFDQAGKLFKHPFQTFLMNAVEDRRIERVGLRQYPGYVYYMEELRDYAIWSHTNAMMYPYQKPDWTQQDKFYDALTMYIGFRNVAPELLPTFKMFGPNDAKFKALTDQVDVICKTPPETFDDAMDQSLKLLELYPDEQKQKQSQKNGCEGKGGKCNNPGSAVAQGTGADGKSAKPTKEQKEAIGDTMGDENEDATEDSQDIKIEDRFSRTDEYDHVNIIPAEEGSFDQGVYKEASEIAKQISKNLSFLDSRFNRTSQAFEMRSGELDEDAIHSLKFNKDVFWEEEEAPGYSMDLGILIDESGSMHGKNIRDAQIAALALALALKDNEHINLYVYGHTANTGGHPITMYRYYDKTEKGSQNINTMFSVRARANNADGYAIKALGDILMKGRSKMKVMIVASDGYPHASGYGGTPAEKHTRQMVQKLELANMFVCQIALEDINSAKMFTNFVPYDKQSLGINLKKVLMKKLVEISNLV